MPSFVTRNPALCPTELPGHRLLAAYCPKVFFFARQCGSAHAAEMIFTMMMEMIVGDDDHDDEENEDVD